LEFPIALGSWAGLEELRPVLKTYLARRCRDESEIDDITQEALLRAARYRGSLYDPARLRAWVIRIAANCLSDHLRREGRLPRGEGSEDVFDRIEGREYAPGETPEELHLCFNGEVMEMELALRHVRGAVRRLRDEDQLVLDAYYTGQQSCAAAAQVCAVTRDLVKCRLYRARRRLRRTLRVRLGTRSDALGPDRSHSSDGPRASDALRGSGDALTERAPSDGNTLSCTLHGASTSARGLVRARD
jgi:RNA polymerase sigma-70 factor (ECF subfamily)